MKAGDRFGRLTVLEVLPNRKARVKCDCGNVGEVYTVFLEIGRTSSCGCFRRERMSEIGKRNGKHYSVNTRSYTAWVNARGTAKKENVPFEPKWEEFENFRTFLYSKGYTETHGGTIRRLILDDGFTEKNIFIVGVKRDE